MLKLAEHAESGANNQNFTELAKFVNEHKDDESFKNNVTFVKIVEQLKTLGII